MALLMSFTQWTYRAPQPAFRLSSTGVSLSLWNLAPQKHLIPLRSLRLSEYLHATIYTSLLPMGSSIQVDIIIS